MKKKILALCLVVVLAITAVTGATLAYFTDTDKETNVMSFGGVDIDLLEDFESNKDFIPGIDNAIKKETTVKNIGEDDAYVRIVYLFEGTYAEVEDYIGYFVSDDGTNNWEWSMVNEVMTDKKLTGARMIYNADGSVWTIAEAVYQTTLAAGVETEPSLHKIFLAPTATQEGIEEHFGSEYTIKVLAQGTQVGEFADAETALNTAFGNLHLASDAEGYVTDATILGWFE